MQNAEHLHKVDLSKIVEPASNWEVKLLSMSSRNVIELGSSQIGSKEEKRSIQNNVNPKNSRSSHQMKNEVAVRDLRVMQSQGETYGDI